MGTLKVLGLLLLLLLYIAFVLIYIHGNERRKELHILMSNQKMTAMKTLSFERKILDRFKVEADSVKFAIYFVRLMFVIVIGVGFWVLNGLALAVFGSIFTTLFFNDAYKSVLYRSGITNIAKVTNFINYFVPHISSGNSADQSFLGYIEYASDDELSNYYENRDNPDYKLPDHLKQIVHIYNIAKYNEDKGIANYTYILNEMNQGISQKQVYHNNFVSKMGEIGPIMLSYYFGVPAIVYMSYIMATDFWQGFGGYVVSTILLILFAIFKFLIFKLQSKVISVIF